MTWTDVKRTLTTPPPPRPPSPKHPLFTRKVFSTKSFGPGHVIGASILVFGLVGITKFFIGRSKDEAAKAPRLAQDDNTRGQYGKRP